MEIVSENRKMVVDLTFLRSHATIGMQKILKNKGNVLMMNRLRGKNLAHPGCLIGTTTGLIIGIILAGILAKVLNTPFTTLLLVWFGLTIVLGTIGWIIGTRLTSKFPEISE
jgi:hypothetical protein